MQTKVIARHALAIVVAALLGSATSGAQGSRDCPTPTPLLGRIALRAASDLRFERRPTGRRLERVQNSQVQVLGGAGHASLCVRLSQLPVLESFRGRYNAVAYYRSPLGYIIAAADTSVSTTGRRRLSRAVLLDPQMRVLAIVPR